MDIEHVYNDNGDLIGVILYTVDEELGRDCEITIGYECTDR